MATEVPIMILFFNRPDCLKKVFEAVRKIQPSQLFLVQDGPRSDRADDFENVQKCRKVVEKIDWECEVYRNYAEVNMSCDHREFTGISWCFEYVDRLIILEDDCVPTKSFVYLCEELLEKYEKDERIHSIAGFNRLGKYEIPYDYIVSQMTAGIGWATWKRVWEKVVEIKELNHLDDKEFIEYQEKVMNKDTKRVFGDYIRAGKEFKSKYDKTQRIPSWEYLQGMVMVLNNMVSITPAKNMIEYCGITKDATHCTERPELLPHKLRNMLMQPAYDINFPIKHPPFLIRDVEFEKKNAELMNGKRLFFLIEVVFLKVRYGDFKGIWKGIMKRLNLKVKLGRGQDGQ